MQHQDEIQQNELLLNVIHAMENEKKHLEKHIKQHMDIIHKVARKINKLEKMRNLYLKKYYILQDILIGPNWNKRDQKIKLENIKQLFILNHQKTI